MSCRVERTTAKHSWNGNWLLTNSVIFRLQRHSDHHAHASRPYQASHAVSAFKILQSTCWCGCMQMPDVPPLLVCSVRGLLGRVFLICAPPAWVAACLQMLRNMPDTPQLLAATLALCYVPFTASLSLEIGNAYADAAQHAGRAAAASLLPSHDDPGAVSPPVPSHYGPPSRCLLRFQPPHSVIVPAEVTFLWSLLAMGHSLRPDLNFTAAAFQRRLCTRSKASRFTAPSRVQAFGWR